MRRVRARVNRATLGYLILALGVTVGFAMYDRTTSRLEEQTRAIQESRIISCRQTYEGIREVFKPFFPPPPRTRAQQRNLDKFNRTIDRLKRRCDLQTQPKETR